MQAQRKTIWCGCAIAMALSLGLLPLTARGQGAAIPLGEAHFESPALPPPLWFTNYLVMKELALPAVKPRLEREAESVGGLWDKARMPSAMLSYTHINGDFGNLLLEDNLATPDVEGLHAIDYDGGIFSAAFSMKWDRERFALGLMMPYERLELDSFDAHRIGAMAYGSYILPLIEAFNQSLFLKFTAAGSYLYNEVDSNIVIVRNSRVNRHFKDFSTIVLNMTVSLGFDTKDFYRSLSTRKDTLLSLISLSGGITASYQLHEDINVKRESIQGQAIVDEVGAQHLFMLGANAGVRIHDRVAVTLYGIWSHDASDYDGYIGRDADENYVDLIIEAAVSIWPELRVNGGYKKVMGYKNFDVNQLFVGVSLRF